MELVDESRRDEENLKELVCITMSITSNSPIGGTSERRSMACTGIHDQISGVGAHEQQSIPQALTCTQGCGWKLSDL
jgi:hypothetical protein